MRKYGKSFRNDYLYRNLYSWSLKRFITAVISGNNPLFLIYIQDFFPETVIFFKISYAHWCWNVPVLAPQKNRMKALSSSEIQICLTDRLTNKIFKVFLKNEIRRKVKWRSFWINKTFIIWNFQNFALTKMHFVFLDSLKITTVHI